MPWSSRLAAALAAALLAVAGAVSAGRITVAREATVSGASVRLGDIAALEGDDAEALAGVVIGISPGAGESRRLDGTTVLQALRRQGADLDRLAYAIPQSVVVRRATQDVDEAAVRQILDRYLTETITADGGDAALRAVELPGPIRIPAGEYTARVVLPPGAALVGRVRLQLEFALDGRPVKSVWVTADVSLFGSVVMARRPIARGETLGRDDLVVDRSDLSQLPRGVVARLDDAAGMVAKAPIPAYAPIRRVQIEPPATVHRGDVVLLVVEHAGLRITAPGEVREDAERGQQVRVVNRMTQKDLVGRVADASTVVVDF